LADKGGTVQISTGMCVAEIIASEVSLLGTFNDAIFIDGRTPFYGKVVFFLSPLKNTPNFFIS
jgi:hypothetical protein